MIHIYSSLLALLVVLLYSRRFLLGWFRHLLFYTYEETRCFLAFANEVEIMPGVDSRLPDVSHLLLVRHRLGNKNNTFPRLFYLFPSLKNRWESDIEEERQSHWSYCYRTLFSERNFFSPTDINAAIYTQIDPHSRCVLYKCWKGTFRYKESFVSFCCPSFRLLSPWIDTQNAINIYSKMGKRKRTKINMKERLSRRQTT